jgi:hypothetical protein
MARDEFDDRRDDAATLIRRAKDKVKAPAIGLIITAVLSLISIPLGAVQYFTLDAQFEEQKKEFPKKNPNATPQQQQEFSDLMDKFKDGMKVALPPFYLLLGVLSVVALFGAIRMLSLRSRGLAYTSAILSLLPCTSGCCLLGIVFGIWAIVALGDSGVKRGFDLVAGRGGAPADDFDPGFDR